MDKFFTNGISTGNLQTIGIEDWVLRKGAKTSTAVYMLAPCRLVGFFFALMYTEFALPLLMF